MSQPLKIGTRESELAVWQAMQVKDLLKENNVESQLVYIKSEGDLNTITPLYELGVQGIFTKTLDAALLNNKIDIAVHSMKDVPTQLATGIRQVAVLKRGSHQDILVLHPDLGGKDDATLWDSVSWTNRESDSAVSHLKIPLWEYHKDGMPPETVVIATSSIRRIAQWLNRNKNDKIANLRGNVNTRLRKLKESKWHGAIFAAAGLERLNLRPEKSIDLDWMLPAPAQGAIMVVCRENDDVSFEACQKFNEPDTALCTKIERDFLRTLLGGCSTPISALAKVRGTKIIFQGNICSVDGKEIIAIQKEVLIKESQGLGATSANEILKDISAQKIMHAIRNEKK